VEGTVDFDRAKNRWVATVDWGAMRHESKKQRTG
jgi:hypothetical protein